MSLSTSLALAIAALDAQMAAITPTTVTSDGTSVTNIEWTKLIDKRVQLENLLGRVNGASPMIVRGFVIGRGRGS